MYEVEQRSAPAPRRREEKRTIFGMAREALGMGQPAPEPAARAQAEEVQRIAVAQVRSVGATPELPAQPALAALGVTAPQFRAQQQAAPMHSRGPHAETHELPQNALPVARPVQTPMPAHAPYLPREPVAEPRYAAGTPYPPEARKEHAYQPAQPSAPAPAPAQHVYHAPPAADSAPQSEPSFEARAGVQRRAEGELYAAGFDPSARRAYAAPPAAYDTQAPLPSRAQQAPTASLGGTDGATAFVDMRQYMAKGVELPAIGRAEQPMAKWNVESSVTTEPDRALAPRVGHAHWARRAAAQDEQVDLNFVLGRKSGRTLLLFGACVVALALALLSVFARPAPSAPAVAETSSARNVRVRESARSVVAAPAANDGERPPTAARLPTQEEPKQARAAQLVAERRSAQPMAQQAVQEPQAEPDEPRASAGATRAEHVSASPERAAALYIGGKYKEALAEYRLLATAYPKQRVYTELARILKRKIIDTCLRTQPNRREQCKEL